MTEARVTVTRRDPYHEEEEEEEEEEEPLVPSGTCDFIRIGLLL
jgi:hypothetical protein